MLEMNRETLTRRWPALLASLEAAPEPDSAFLRTDTIAPTLDYEGIQLSSAYDRFNEASIQARLIPASSTKATVYGLALGDLPRILLARDQLEHLHVAVSYTHLTLPTIYSV